MGQTILLPGEHTPALSSLSMFTLLQQLEHHTGKVDAISGEIARRIDASLQTAGMLADEARRP